MTGIPRASASGGTSSSTSILSNAERVRDGIESNPAVARVTRSGSTDVIVFPLTLLRTERDLRRPGCVAQADVGATLLDGGRGL